MRIRADFHGVGMAKRTKVPLAHAHPAVRALVDQLLASGYSAPQTHEQLQRLAGDEDERARLCPGAGAADLRRVSLRSIYERARFLRAHPERPDAQMWLWWEEPEPEVAELVLAATAQYEVTTGRPWYPLTKGLVDRLARLVVLAPGLPLPAALVLAHWWLSWENLPARARLQYLSDLEVFLKYRPWTSAAAAELYRRVANRLGVRYELNDQGTLLVIVQGWRLELERDASDEQK